MLKIIKVEQVNDTIYESSIDYPLTHLPSVFHDKTISDVKIIEKDSENFILVLYSNGAVVLTDLNKDFIAS